MRCCLLLIPPPCFTGSTKVNSILQQVLAALAQDSQRTFIWTETAFLKVFLHTHGNEQVPQVTPQQTWKQLLKHLVQAKQLEFCSGGLVSHDEASTKAEPIFDIHEQGLLLRARMCVCMCECAAIDKLVLRIFSKLVRLLEMTHPRAPNTNPCLHTHTAPAC